jgi:hypothetical protein
MIIMTTDGCCREMDLGKIVTLSGSSNPINHAMICSTENGDLFDHSDYRLVLDEVVPHEIMYTHLATT